MREFQYLHVKGIPFFKDQKFDLSRKGISVILGLNKNSGQTGNTNFVGKSLFFSQILEAVVPGTDLSNPKDKFKSGSIEVGVKANKKDYAIRRIFKSPEKMVIEENGVDLEIHGLTSAKERAAKIIGHSAERLSLLMYLDNTKPHLIRSGDTGVRRAFFTDFFNLAVTDTIRKMVKAEKDELTGKAVLLEELKSRYRTLKSQMEGKSLSDLESALTKAKAKAKAAMKSLESIRELETLSSFVKANSKAYNTYLRHADSYLELRAELKSINKALQSAEALDEYKAEVQTYRKQLKRRLDYLTENGLEDFDVKAVKTALQDGLEGFKQAEKEHSEHLRIRDQKVAKKRDLKASLEDAKIDLKSLKPAGDCSKCGQPVTNAHYKKEKRELENRIAELTEKFEAFEIEDAPDAPQRPRKLVKLESLLEKWYEAPQEPDVPEKPEGLTKVEDPESLRERKEQVQEILSRINVVKDSGLEDKLKDESWQGSYREGEFDSALLEATKSSEAASKAESELDRFTEINKEGKEVGERLKVLKVELGELEVLEVMEKAYASQAGGIKQIMINNLCNRLADQVNKYAKLLLPEDYEFTFDLQTQFSIIVTRNVGSKKESSDIRKLSGAEGPCFDLVLTMSLLSFVPPRYRPNILVLDELNANFSAEMTASFIRFLPVLNQVIPHIIVITPKTEDNYGENVTYFTVVKKGASSRIVEGRIRK